MHADQPAGQQCWSSVNAVLRARVNQSKTLNVCLRFAARRAERGGERGEREKEREKEREN